MRRGGKKKQISASGPMPGNLEAILSSWQCAWPSLIQNLIPLREASYSFMPSHCKALQVSFLTLQSSFMSSGLYKNPQDTHPLPKVAFGAPLSGWASQSCKRSVTRQRLMPCLNHLLSSLLTISLETTMNLLESLVLHPGQNQDNRLHLTSN